MSPFTVAIKEFHEGQSEIPRFGFCGFNRIDKFLIAVAPIYVVIEQVEMVGKKIEVGFCFGIGTRSWKTWWSTTRQTDEHGAGFNDWNR